MTSQNNAFQTGQDYEPEIPDPILEELPEGIAFPIDCLPGLLGETIQEITRLAQCPESLAGGSVLAAACLASQTFVDVCLPHGEVKPTSSYFLTIAPSGERKSTADTLAMAPVELYRRSLQEDYDEKYPSYKNACDAWKTSREMILKKKQR
ncbi:MAG: DUF3987 domain-containing protein [Cyanobacteria bacterium]|nr:DUF3987 domain-containing protein [Cyanobacteriota bacterium]